MSKLKDTLQRLRSVRRLSPGGFLLYAAIFALGYALCHALGMRELTSVVCGNPGAVWGSRYMAVALACLYILLYFAAVVGAPILVIGAGVFAVLRRLCSAKKDEAPGGPSEPDGLRGV